MLPGRASLAWSLSLGGWTCCSSSGSSSRLGGLPGNTASGPLYDSIVTARRRQIDRWREPMRLEGKVAVIAGSGDNMSRATALLFAQEGARVYLLARSADKSGETVRLAEARGGHATYVQTDLTHDGA